MPSQHLTRKVPQSKIVVSSILHLLQALFQLMTAGSFRSDGLKKALVINISSSSSPLPPHPPKSSQNLLLILLFKGFLFSFLPIPWLLGPWIVNYPVMYLLHSALLQLEIPFLKYDSNNITMGREQNWEKGLGWGTEREGEFMSDFTFLWPPKVLHSLKNKVQIF